MDRFLFTLRFIIMNGGTIGLGVAGFIYGIKGAQNFFEALVWLGIVVAALSMNVKKENITKYKLVKYIPHSVDMIIDLIVFGLLAWHGLFVTAGCYVIVMISMSMKYHMYEEYKNDSRV